ncbi:hypothetical protein RI570_05075 [Brucella pseudogrignonensis]|uniref:hypothetical protein n=1 Tax=Brucella pseudogrignonensis TaxID=419475 RepID=UPI0028B80552|nr:hypothetical protein [Brucella pseudogrignonensis]MDT6939517.1 hypothetical protein [Brucella pseudogrignonensis]
MVSTLSCHRHSGSLKTALFGFSLLLLTACEPTSATNAEILPPAGPDIGKWKVSVSTDAMTDKKKTVITLQADDSDISLKLFCDGKDAAALVNWNDYLGVEDWASTDVTQRIGEGRPRKEGWYADPNGEVTHAGYARGFIEEVREANRLVMRVTPYKANPKTTTFDTSGLTEALKANRPDCNPFIRDVLRDEDVQRVLKEKAAKAAASQSGAAQ